MCVCVCRQAGGQHYNVGPVVIHLFVHAKVKTMLFLIGAEQISMEDCCKNGQKHGTDHEDCASLPLISESTTCR